MVDKTKCSCCGYNQFKGSLHIHHVDGDHNNNAFENLEVLCSNCHFEYHNKHPVRYKGHRTSKIPKKTEYFYLTEIARLMAIIHKKDNEIQRLSELAKPKDINMFFNLNYPIELITPELDRQLTAHVPMR